MLIELVKKLILFRSISPRDDGAILFLKDCLERMGFYTEIIESSGVKNLFACMNRNKDIDLCFAGHIDVVPPGELISWNSDPFSAEIINNTVYGRGIVDMKGAIACFIAAIKEYHGKQNIGIIITGDEELDSQNGIVPIIDFIKRNKFKITNCIVGEPTCKVHVGDIIKIGRRGSINFKVEIYGKSGHAAYPENIKNPIKFMIKPLQNLVDHEFDLGNEHFQPSHCEVTSIKVDNEISNVTPGKVWLFFNIRFNNLHSVESLTNTVNKIFSGYEVSYNPNPALPFLVSDMKFAEKFATTVYNITGRNPEFSTGGGTSDARFLKDITNVIEFGLLNRTVHQANECCAIEDLITLKNVYLATLKFL